MKRLFSMKFVLKAFNEHKYCNNKLCSYPSLISYVWKLLLKEVIKSLIFTITKDGYQQNY